MNKTIKEEIKKEIFDFKSKMFRKYNKRVYCYYKKNNPIKEPISLSELWGLFVDYTEKNYPKYMAYITFEERTRKRTWMTINQCFHYIAYRDIGYTKTAIAQFIGRHHATVINSIKNAESYLNDEDPIFMGIYDETYKKYKEYVGIISENTTV
jgi:hypothetical protein